MPPSVLSAVGDRAFQTDSPLLVKVFPRKTGGPTCFGTVLEFAADEGTVVLPKWMIEHVEVSTNGGQV